MVNIDNTWQSVTQGIGITKINTLPCMGEKLQEKLRFMDKHTNKLTKRTIGQTQLLPMTITVTDTGQFGDDAEFQVLRVLQHMAKTKES